MTGRPIIFYFPYRGVGGVSTLFLRLADAMKDDCQVYLADFSDGYMAKNLPDGVVLINIEDNPQFPKGGVFIFQSFLPWRFPFLSKVDPDSKILFWGLHPQNFDAQIFNEFHQNVVVSLFAKIINIAALWRKDKLVKVIRYLQRRDAILFMGRENVGATEKYLKCSVESPVFLPVPISSVSLRKSPPVFPKVLECAWIGRLCDFKYRILEHIICRLSSASKMISPIRLTIVGDGEYRTYLEGVAESSSTQNFSVVFRGEIPMATIPDYLVEKVDILFAMGTSALEGARVGVPVFLSDFSNEKIVKNYHFNHFFDNKEYSLGEEITSIKYEKQSSLEDSLQAVISDYSSYSTQSYDYWAANFRIKTSKEKLLFSLDRTTATFGEMDRLKFFKPDFFGRFFRVLPSLFRKDLSKDIVGFRHDC